MTERPILLLDERFAYTEKSADLDRCLARTKALRLEGKARPYRRVGRRG